MRTYEKTHKWITFKADLREIPYNIWMLLGEAQSKCAHIAGIPLMPAVAEDMHQVYLAKGALATTAIEGNTLTEEEVLKRLEGKLELPPSKEYLGKEIDNIIESCNLIKNHVLNEELKHISIEKIKNFNRLVLKGLPNEKEVSPGEIRKCMVDVARYRAVEPQDCEFLLKKLCQWLNEEFVPPQGQTIAFGILKSILSHLYIAWIHPFMDGNGRTARLLEFQILLTSGVPSASAHLLSNHYNETRQEYYRQLDNASKSGGNIVPFIEYALQGFVDGLKSQINLIRKQQLEVHWINFIHFIFKDKHTTSDHRRRDLILDLSKHDAGIPVSKVKHITPQIAEKYANKTQKTLIRDINILGKMDLIKKTKEGILPRKEIILAFLPPTLHVD
ncbi:MAG: Fic family protein [Planctomycetes bacterium]|nr:Fic family protein [Planctomycetota bacterium]